MESLVSILTIYSHIFAGDSVIVNEYDNDRYMETRYLTNTVNFLFIKSGYKSEFLTIELFPKVLLTRDIVLLEED